MPGGVLLSHGEAPHYHRRKTFSLLSSGWDQVVPVRYGYQANRSNSFAVIPICPELDSGPQCDPEK